MHRLWESSDERGQSNNILFQNVEKAGNWSMEKISFPFHTVDTTYLSIDLPDWQHLLCVFMQAKICVIVAFMLKWVCSKKLIYILADFSPGLWQTNKRQSCFFIVGNYHKELHSQKRKKLSLVSRGFVGSKDLAYLFHPPICDEIIHPKNLILFNSKIQRFNKVI